MEIANIRKNFYLQEDVLQIFVAKLKLRHAQIRLSTTLVVKYQARV